MTEQHQSVETPYAKLDAWITATPQTLHFAYRITKKEGYTLAVCDGMRPRPPARGTDLEPEGVMAWLSDEDHLEIYRGVERIDPSVSKESLYVPYSRWVEDEPAEGSALLRLPHQFEDGRWLTSREQSGATGYDTYFSIDVRYREGETFRADPTPVEGYVLVRDVAAKLGRLEARFDTKELVFVGPSP